MKTAFLILLAACMTVACSRQATLLPPGDHSHKVIGQASSLQAAQKAAESEATRTCRKTQEVPETISQRTAVVDSTEPGGTQYRVILHFNCVGRDF